MTNQTLVERLESAKPRTDSLLRHVEDAWTNFQANHVTPARRPPHRRSLIGLGALAVVGSAIAIVVALLPNVQTPSATGATLHKAALADASAAVFPTLASGQYYYQEAQVTMNCVFASPTSPLINYVSEGTIESWTSPQAAGQIVITPAPIDEDGSHFSTPADEAAWIAAGKPFVPCALASPSNSLGGNPANTDTAGSLGGYTATISGGNGFGMILDWAQEATPEYVNGVPSLILNSDESTTLTPRSNVANLPSDVSQIASLIANGELSPDGSLATSPQVCPVNAIAGTGVGCDTNQQLALIKQLLQLPDASAKFGSVLYQVLEQFPGAIIEPNATDGFGNTGTNVTVPILVGPDSTGAFETTGEFQVLINPSTGVLLSSTELHRVPGGNGSTDAFAPDASISYGPISVVTGLGTVSAQQNVPTS